MSLKTVNKTPFKKVSKRETILLAILFLAVEIYLLYSFVVGPKMTQYLDAKDQYNSTVEKVTIAQSEFNKKDEYESKLKLVKYKKDQLSKQIRPYLSQEETILTLSRFAKQAGIDILSYSFGAIEVKNVADVQNSTNASAPEGQAQPSANSTEGQQNNAAQADANTKTPSIQKQNVSLSIQSDYSSLVKFYKLLEDNQDKYYIYRISMDRKSNSDISSTVTVTKVMYNDGNNIEEFKLDTPAQTGKDNMFKAYNGYMESVVDITGENQPAAVEKVSSIPNFVLMLNTFQDNAPKIIFKEFGNTGSEVYSDKNNVVKGKLDISKDGDKYTYSYSLDGETWQKEKETLYIRDKILRLEIISQPRSDAADKVSVVLDINNKTSLPMEINVSIDDKSNPRFKLGTTTGKVSIK